MIVPELAHNLLSARKLEILGYKMTIESGKVVIEKGNEIVAIAERNESQLYALNFTRNYSVNLIESVNICHNRFGHLNYSDIKLLSERV